MTEEQELAAEQASTDTDKELAAIIAALLLSSRRNIKATRERVVEAAIVASTATGTIKPFTRDTARAVAGFQRKLATIFAQHYDLTTIALNGALSRVLKQAVFTMRKMGVPNMVETVDKELLASLLNITRQKFNELSFAAQRRIAQGLLDHITNRTSRADLIRFVEGVLVDREGVPGRDLEELSAALIVDDIFNHYRTIVAAKADEAGVENFLYNGTIIETTRPFCRPRAGNVYDRETINSWASMEWRGKSGHPMVHCGGYNCRHHWVPVP